MASRTFFILAAAILTLAIGLAKQAPAVHGSDTSSQSSSFRDGSFDYVVVGGGTAGLALATRLVEGSASTVAVIEAGGFYEQDNSNLSTVPAYCLTFTGTDPSDTNPLVDWGFVTEPQTVRKCSF